MPRPRAPFLLRPSRRTILLACILLLAGAIVNVAVAWVTAALASGYVSNFRTAFHTHSVEIVNQQCIDTMEVGWPLRSLGATTARPDLTVQDFWSPEPASTHGPYARGILIPDQWRPRNTFLFQASDWRAPTDPIWPGFAINTLFYTAILALPLSFFPIRRRLRARRGRCPACGYDRAGLADAAPCPECSAS